MQFEDSAEAEYLSSIVDIAIEGIAEGCPEVIADLQQLEPVQTAATLAGLLAVPDLQANCIRLEALVHLAVAYCKGRAAPTEAFVRRNFDRLNKGYCGRVEDPAEDQFAILVNTPRGNFRIFQGVREGAGFYLQRILNIVEDMPDRAPFKRIRESVECLLKLSEAVATRAGVSENILGREMPLATVPAELVDRLSNASGSVRFSEDELAGLKIPKDSLTDFVFSLDGQSQLRAQTLGHSDLERRPVAVHDGSFYLLLPTAVASAITRLVVESVSSMRLEDSFERALSNEYGQLFHGALILGGRLPGPIVFERIPGGGIAAAMKEIDPGRILHLVFFLDGLDGFVADGLNGMNADPESLSAALCLHLSRASAEARKHVGFHDALTLFVGCGFGRGLRLELKGGLPEHWRLEIIGAHDLVTLNWLSGFDALSLWRLLNSRETIERQGTLLFNVNGLINLVAWSRELGGHLVPHGQLPDDFVKSGYKNIVVVRQNALRDLRHSVMTEWNPRRVLDPEGHWVKVIKLDKSPFEEDNRAPFYGSEEDVQNGKLRAVYVAPKRSWWIEIVAPELAPRESVYQHWMMLCVWLRRAAPILDDAYESLPRVPISFRVTFEEIVGATSGAVRLKSANELRSLLRVFAEAGSSIIRIIAGKGFHDGFVQPENFAERAVVEALVAGAATASGEDVDADKLEILVNRICPNSQARWIHRFQARFFRDYVGAEIQGSPTLIDPLDDAASRIGLGWKVRSRDSSAEISGIWECTSYVNEVVRVVLDDLCTLLQELDRRSFVTDIILNHEAAAHDRDVWKRTAQANLALHGDKEGAVRAIQEHHGRLNVCFLASRILLEAAICECPPQGGRIPGRIDLSRAMALAVQAHHYGGWSDALRWGAIEPRVRITPLGDVHIKHDFIDAVYEPFGRAVSEELVKQDTDSYSNLYAPVKVLPSVSSVLDPSFLDAWQAEFGVSMDGFRAFLDKLEDIDRQPVTALLDFPRSAVAEMLAASAGISSTNSLMTLNMLTLVPRPAWRVVSGEFVEKDWFPWRFRRRLSVLRRPFIQINSGDDPTIVVAPGLVRDAVYATMGFFHSGEIPSSQTRSSQMRKWIGHANHVQRTEFNSKVALRMRELGWQAKAGIKVTEILGRSLDRNYGDIDVLAWRPDSCRVLVMECKDLQFNKTLGEVAEQLADFRGEKRPDGIRDPLKRHLDRIEVLVAHKLEVSSALKLAAPVQIEGHLVFKNPVPMRFAWERMRSRIQLSLFAELDRL
jgi:hypothetical protein